MAHSFTWEEEGIYWKYYATLRSKDIIHANSEIFGDPRFEIIKYIIWDASEIDQIELDEKDISISTSFAVIANPHNMHVKVAFLAQNEKLRELIGKYIEQTLLQIPHAKQILFDNADDARAWVNS